MLKFTYDSEAEVPAANKPLYADDGTGKFVLQVEGAVPKATVDEFRKNNIALTKERDALADKFKGVDPAEYTSLKARSAELAEGALIKKEGLEAAVEARVKTMRTEFDQKLADTASRLTATTAEMGKLKIDSALITEATKLGLRPEAAQDFIYRGREVFRLDDDGNVQAFEQDGKTKRFGASGTVMSIPEFVTTAAKDKAFSHLFQASGGGGAAGGGKGQQGAVNPFKRATLNLTEQAKITRDNPTLAQQLRQEALTAQ